MLEQIGCTVSSGDGWVEVQGPQQLRGIDIDMSKLPDMAITLAALAPFADSPTHIRNVALIRHHETDRIAATVAELRKLGVVVEERADGLTILPGWQQPAEIDFISRSPHGDGLRGRRFEDSGPAHRWGGMRCQDVSRFL